MLGNMVHHAGESLKRPGPNCLLKNGYRHAAGTVFRGFMHIGSEPVPIFQRAAKPKSELDSEQVQFGRLAVPGGSAGYDAGDKCVPLSLRAALRR